MNLNLLKLGLLVFGLSALMSCSKDNNSNNNEGPSSKPHIQLSSVVFKTTGQNGERKFNVTANRAWKVELTAEQKAWISVSPESGVGEGVKEPVTVTIGKNMDVSPRVSDIKFVIDEDPTIFSTFKISQGTEYMFEKDSLILVDFYNSTNGPNWTKPWNLSEPVAKWGYYNEDPVTGKKQWDGASIGTDADNSRRVTALWWSVDNNMKGVFPESFGNLSALGGITLSGFKSAEGFTFSSLLSILKNIPNMTHLWLNEGCTFNGSRIGNDLADLPKLFSLNITDHDFVGFTEDFGTVKFPELVGFFVVNGEFEAELATKYFANMPRITVISVVNNKFTGVVPENFTASKPSLLAIELAGNCLTGVFPASIRNSAIFANSEGQKMICPQNADCGGGFTSGCE